MSLNEVREEKITTLLIIFKMSVLDRAIELSIGGLRK